MRANELHRDGAMQEFLMQYPVLYVKSIAPCKHMYYAWSAQSTMRNSNLLHLVITLRTSYCKLSALQGLVYGYNRLWRTMQYVAHSVVICCKVY